MVFQGFIFVYAFTVSLFCIAYQLPLVIEHGLNIRIFLTIRRLIVSIKATANEIVELNNYMSLVYCVVP